MTQKIRTNNEYKMVLNAIDDLLVTATESGGLNFLSSDESIILSKLSLLAQEYEDDTLKLMPMK